MVENDHELVRFMNQNILNYIVNMPDQDRVRRKRSSNKRKSSAQKRHQERAKHAMTLWKSGKASSLKAAWKRV